MRIPIYLDDETEIFIIKIHDIITYYFLSIEIEIMPCFIFHCIPENYFRKITRLSEFRCSYPKCWIIWNIFIRDSFFDDIFISIPR